MADSNNVFFGLSKVYVSVATISGDTISYAKPVAIPNAQSFSMSRDISEQKIYADNKCIYTVSSQNGATITLQFSAIPDEIKQLIANHKKDSSGHDCEVTNDATKYFALIGQLEGDVKARRFCFLKCTAHLGDESSSSTGDSITIGSETLTISATPVTIGDNDVLRYDVKKGDADYETLITTKPTLPTFGA